MSKFYIKKKVRLIILFFLIIIRFFFLLNKHLIIIMMWKIQIVDKFSKIKIITVIGILSSNENRSDYSLNTKRQF